MSDPEPLRRHSKSFALAARLLPRAEWKLVKASYARYLATDDRIDHSHRS